MKVEDTQTLRERQKFLAIATLMARGCDGWLTSVDKQETDSVVCDQWDGTLPTTMERTSCYGAQARPVRWQAAVRPDLSHAASRLCL